MEWKCRPVGRERTHGSGASRPRRGFKSPPGNSCFDPLREKRPREKVQVEANLGLEPLLGTAGAHWENLSLARVIPGWAKGDFRADPQGAFAEAQQTGVKITGNLGLKGAFSRAPFKAEGFVAQARGEWGEKGLVASAVLNLERGGNLETRVSSAEALQGKFPNPERPRQMERGRPSPPFPILPASLILKGRSEGQATGQWFPGLQFEAAGAVKVLQTGITWQAGENPFPWPSGRPIWISPGRREAQGPLGPCVRGAGRPGGQFELPGSPDRGFLPPGGG